MAQAKSCVISRGPKKGKLKKGYRYKNGRCVKKKRKTPCQRATRKIDGVTVALPCRAKSLTAAQEGKLDTVFTAAQWNKCADQAGCRVIFFTAGQPVMRRPRKGGLKRAAAKRPMPCVNKKGKFVKCARKGAKRLRRGR